MLEYDVSSVYIISNKGVEWNRFDLSSQRRSTANKEHSKERPTIRDKRKERESESERGGGRGQGTNRSYSDPTYQQKTLFIYNINYCYTKGKD
jgi:hypothetical protein